MFANMDNLTSLDLSNFNTINVANYMSMFSGCSGLKLLNLSSFNLLNGEKFTRMFYQINNLTLWLNKNTSNISGFNDEIPKDANIHYI